MEEMFKNQERFKRVKSSIDIYAMGKLKGPQGVLQPSHIHLASPMHD